MSERNTLHFSIAPPAQVGRDLKRNLPWLISIAAFLLIYILASAFLASKLEKWTYLHAAYFTVINTTTVGFGDVVPATHLGKLLAGMNAFVGLIAFGGFVSALTMALQPASYSATVDLPKPERLSRDKKPRTGDTSSIDDFFCGLQSLFKSIEIQPPEKENEDVQHRRVRIRVRRLDPHYITIDIVIDLNH
jgi:hypothetical protein